VIGRAALTGAVTASLGLALLVVVCLVSWVAAAHTSSPVSAPLRTAIALWAWSLHAGMSMHGVPVTLTPLGLMALPTLLAWAGGRWLGRAGAPPTLAAGARQVGVYAASFAGVGALASIAGIGDPAYASPVWVAVWSLLVAGAAGGAGLVGAARAWPQVMVAIPAPVRTTVRAGTAAAAVVLAAAGVLTAVCLAAALPDAASITDRLDAGWWGAMVVALLAVAFVPNVVVWAGSVLVGPGFAVGTATEISPRVVEYGALPAFPPVAALPPEGVVPVAAWAVLLIPVAAGVLAGLLVARRMAIIAELDAGRDNDPVVATDPARVAAWAAGSGLVTALWWGLLAWLSAGAMGVNRLSVVGPPAVRVAVTIALEVGLVAALTAWEVTRHGWVGRSVWRNVSATD
jgi:hypothetical protein